jgi:dTMP kinase
MSLQFLGINMIPERKFIVLEGMDFCGKTTTANALYEHYLSQDLPVILTREPGGFEYAEKIRDILLNDTVKIEPLTELLLFMSVRNEHLNTVVLPALRKGNIVICDRFLGSSFVYQGIGKQLGTSCVNSVFNLINTPQIESMLDNDMCTFVLDIDYSTAMHRSKLDNRTVNRLDVTHLDDYTLQRASFKNLATYHPCFRSNFDVVDASDTLGSTLSAIIKILEIQEHAK